MPIDVAWGHMAACDAAPSLAAASVIEQLGKGGVIALAIAALSVLLVTLGIMYLVYIRHAAQCPEELLEEVEERLAKRDYRDAASLLEADPSALAVVLEALLKHRGESAARMGEVLSDAAAEQATHLSQRVAYIGLIAAIAPMLGLLGTVSGMIRAFATMSTTPAAPDASSLAGAISEALITTYLGLIVAIPAMIAHMFFRHRVINITLRIGEMGEQVIDTLRANAGPARSPSSKTVPRAAPDTHAP